MIRYFLFIAFAFLTGAAVADEIGSVQVFLTPDEGRDKLFPDAVEFVREVQHLDVVVKRRVAADLGLAFADDSLEVFLAYGKGHAFQGYAIVSE